MTFPNVKVCTTDKGTRAIIRRSAVNGDWLPCYLSELKKGDTFRIYDNEEITFVGIADADATPGATEADATVMATGITPSPAAPVLQMEANEDLGDEFTKRFLGNM